MPDCGTCDMCIYRATGAKPEPRDGMGPIKFNTDCRAHGIEIVNLDEFAPTARELEIRNSMAMRRRMHSNGDPVLNAAGQQVIEPGQALLARPAPEGGYLIILKAEEAYSAAAWEALGDYLCTTVRFRFGERRMKVEIRIT